MSRLIAEHAPADVNIMRDMLAREFVGILNK